MRSQPILTPVVRRWAVYLRVSSSLPWPCQEFRQRRALPSMLGPLVAYRTSIAYLVSDWKEPKEPDQKLVLAACLGFSLLHRKACLLFWTKNHLSCHSEPWKFGLSVPGTSRLQRRIRRPSSA